MSGNADRVDPGGSDRDQFIGPDRSPPPLHAVVGGGGQERNVHGAQDLLHLKYSEETHFRTTQEQTLFFFFKLFLIVIFLRYVDMKIDKRKGKTGKNLTSDFNNFIYDFPDILKIPLKSSPISPWK